MYASVPIFNLFTRTHSLTNPHVYSGADLGFFLRESKILGSDRCDVIAMTSPIRGRHNVIILA